MPIFLPVSWLGLEVYLVLFDKASLVGMASGTTGAGYCTVFGFFLAGLLLTSIDQEDSFLAMLFSVVMLSVFFESCINLKENLVRSGSKIEV